MQKVGWALPTTGLEMPPSWWAEPTLRIHHSAFGSRSVELLRDVVEVPGGVRAADGLVGDRLLLDLVADEVSVGGPGARRHDRRRRRCHGGGGRLRLGGCSVRSP